MTNSLIIRPVMRADFPQWLPLWEGYNTFYGRAGATALPEISSGIAAVRLGDHALAMGDIFGGNAFQVCLFLVADLVAGTPVLPSAGPLNAWLAALGVALTAVYGFGVISRPMRTRFRLGPDSLLALALFGLGIAGLFYVPH